MSISHLPISGVSKMEKCLNVYFSKDMEIKDGIKASEAEISYLKFLRTNLVKDLRKELIAMVDLFELLPYFDSEEQKQFIEWGRACGKLPWAQNVPICIEMNSAFFRVTAGNSCTFSYFLGEIPSSYDTIKNLPKLIQEHLNLSKSLL